MKNFLSAARRFLRDEEGVTAIEYGLIAALIVVVSIATLTTIGTDLKAAFVKVDAGLKP
jgi:pilus assembly protein Flp/PilA